MKPLWLWHHFQTVTLHYVSFCKPREALFSGVIFGPGLINVEGGGKSPVDVYKIIALCWSEQSQIRDLPFA